MRFTAEQLARLTAADPAQAFPPSPEQKIIIEADPQQSMKVTAGEGAVLKMGDKVLVTDHAWKGFIAGVYEFIETPEETGYSYIECRLNLISMSAELFEDGGHAIAWAMQQ